MLFYSIIGKSRKLKEGVKKNIHTHKDLHGVALAVKTWILTTVQSSKKNIPLVSTTIFGNFIGGMQTTLCVSFLLLY